MDNLFNKLREASVFQPPSPEEVAKRHPDAIQFLGMWIPNSIYQELSDKYNGNKELMGVAAAFGDSIGISYRNLDWQGVSTDSDTFIKQVEIVDGYNAFDVDIAKKLVEILGEGYKFALGREGSVVVYVTPALDEEREKVERNQEDLRVDEIDLRNGALRLWWD